MTRTECVLAWDSLSPPPSNLGRSQMLFSAPSSGSTFRREESGPAAQTTPVRSDGAIPPEGEEEEEMNEEEEEAAFPKREWRDTGLGLDLKEKRRPADSRDEQFTVVSYNVLADSLMEMHRELYHGEEGEALPKRGL